MLSQRKRSPSTSASTLTPTAQIPTPKGLSTFMYRYADSIRIRRAQLGQLDDNLSSNRLQPRYKVKLVAKKKATAGAGGKRKREDDGEEKVLVLIAEAKEG
ncbi:hypothetical protein V5O48_005664 [Marasmius crinis-equi]|uniref:Uncharacterized protein n=1 Tax=Marasmius crinis-equi TaxID=585013 RepID=A0ABR3FM22_9AGAR